MADYSDVLFPKPFGSPVSFNTLLSHQTAVRSGEPSGDRSRGGSDIPLHSQPMHTLGLTFHLWHRPDGTVAFTNISTTCHDFFEVSATEIEADANRLLGLLSADDRAHFYASLEQASQEACEEAGGSRRWCWEGLFNLASGSVKAVQCDAQSQSSTERGILWTGVMVDRTSQRRLNAEVERLSFLLGLTERLQTSTDLHDISRFALDYLVQTTQCAFGDVKVVRMVDEQVRAFPVVNHISGEFVATYGQPAAAEMEAVLKQGQPQGQGLFWQVIETGKPVFVSDYANHPQAVPALRHPGIGQIGIFPIPASDGSILGVLTLETRNLQHMRSLPQQDLILAACRILGVRIEQAKAKESLEQQTRRLEKTLQELSKTQMQLIQSEKMSSLGQLVAGVAHEINNPVSFIQGNLPYAEDYIQTLLHILSLYQQHYPQPASEIQEAIAEVELPFVQQDLLRLLNSMRVGTDRIREIVRSLRNFSRLDEAEMKPVDIHEGIDNSVMILEHRLRAQAERPAIEIVRDYGNLPLVDCYAGQLNQVFMNVLVNAIDALDEAIENGTVKRDSFTPTIRIQTQISDRQTVQIRIADNGPGIPPEVQGMLFNPFFTTKPVGKGTGMGLSISYQIITEKHGGSLHCGNLSGGGAEFAIEIPISQSVEDV